MEIMCQTKPADIVVAQSLSPFRLFPTHGMQHAKLSRPSLRLGDCSDLGLLSQ